MYASLIRGTLFISVLYWIGEVCKYPENEIDRGSHMKNKWTNRSKKKKRTQKSSDKVIRLFPSYKEGLTAEQVKERIEKGAANDSSHIQNKPTNYIGKYFYVFQFDLSYLSHFALPSRIL